MPSPSPADVKFEIGHVLVFDLVGYSKLLINDQSEQMQKLREIVRGILRRSTAREFLTRIRRSQAKFVIRLIKFGIRFGAVEFRTRSR